MSAKGRRNPHRKPQFDKAKKVQVFLEQKPKAQDWREREASLRRSAEAVVSAVKTADMATWMPEDERNDWKRFDDIFFWGPVGLGIVVAIMFIIALVWDEVSPATCPLHQFFL